MSERARLEKLRLFYQRFHARKIALIWKRILERRKNLARRILQSFVRKRLAVREYGVWQRAQRRVLVIQLDQFPKYVMDNPAKHLVVVCVVDPVKHTQLFRYEALVL